MPGTQLTLGSLILALVALVLALVHVAAAVAVALALGGVAWILALSTLNSLYQLSLPQWVKARGMSFYLVVFQGGNAIGSAVMGVAAGRAGLTPTFLIAAAGLALGPLAGLRYRFRQLRPEELVPAGDWPQPQLPAEGSNPGPVLVTVEYHALPGREADLLAALEDSRFARRRTGRRPGAPGRTARRPGGYSSSSLSRPSMSTSASTSALPPGTRPGTPASGHWPAGRSR
jgi:hypothetical protein